MRPRPTVFVIICYMVLSFFVENYIFAFEFDLRQQFQVMQCELELTFPLNCNVGYMWLKYAYQISSKLSNFGDKTCEREDGSQQHLNIDIFNFFLHED
jgi:hypothetical protein